MQIIKANLEYADIVAEIHSKAWKQAYKGIFPSYFLEKESVLKRKREFLDSCADKNTDYYLIIDDKPVGIVKIKNDENVCEILSMYILDEARNKGIGTKTIQTIVNKYYPKVLVLWTLEQNKSARCFYEKNGFRKVDEERIINRGKDFVQVKYESFGY